MVNGNQSNSSQEYYANMGSVRSQEAESDLTGDRCGCFLSDLTGLAMQLSASAFRSIVQNKLYLQVFLYKNSLVTLIQRRAQA